MTSSLNQIYSQFISFGTISTPREREKIIEILDAWKTIPLEASNINKKYLDTINQYLKDSKINKLLQNQPYLKEEIVKRIFKSLEKIETVVISKSKYQSEHDIIAEFQDSTINKSREKELVGQSKVLSKEDYSNYENQVKVSAEKLKNQKEVAFKNLYIKILKHWRTLNIKNTQSLIGSKFQDLGIYTDEEELLNDFQELNTANFIKDWKTWNNYKEFLKHKYKKREFDLNKFQEEYKRIEKKNLETKFSEVKIENEEKKEFIENWENKLNLKKLEEEIEAINELRKEFLIDLYSKISELQDLLKLLNPFLSETENYGRLWDLSVGNFRSVNFALLQEYSEILKKKSGIKELAELLGRYRRAEVEIEEEEFERIETVSKYRIEHNGKSELVGITESDDLNNLLPTEIALFSDLQTESIFFKRFAEKKLQTFKYVDRTEDYDQKIIREKQNKKVEKNKGPFIIAVDTSGSMHGEPEQLAKIIAFAITKMATKDNRKAYLISFSTGIETFELTDLNTSLPKLLDFLGKSFYGGTDVSEAVRETVKQMETESYEKADLLIISDGAFGSLNKEVIKSINKLKTKGNKFNALIINNYYNKESLNFCNNVWAYNSSENSIRDLVSIIGKDLIK